MKQKHILIVLGVVVFLLASFMYSTLFMNRGGDARTSYQAALDNIGQLMSEKKYDDALTLLEEQKGEMTQAQYDTQKNRISTIRAYDQFYLSNDASAKDKMIEEVMLSIDRNFETVASNTASNLAKATALSHVAFLYSETWSDDRLLNHIGARLSMQIVPAGDPLKKVEVLNTLLTQSIEFFPTQDAYLKRAWFKSRLLVTTKNIDKATRAKLVEDIKTDVSLSKAQDGLQSASASRYYNAYVALAYADILDVLYQEKIMTDYATVEHAYIQALSLASAQFFGNVIVQDITRMNYAASMHRADEKSKKEMIISMLDPVANNIRSYSKNRNVEYEGILVMLRAVPVLKNQNNASLFSIFHSYQEFGDIPEILGWKNMEVLSDDYVYKMI